jgi:chemotaxis signal transduction protein
MINAAITRHMSSVEDYRKRLATLQGSWDTLSLLSHLSGDATELGGTRQAFENLTNELVGNLTAAIYRKALLALKAQGQIAIDVMVRNLFERTADIGFLSTDDNIREYLRTCEPGAPAPVDPAKRAAAAANDALGNRLRHRFREYVEKYSVYNDVILLAPDGRVLLRLDDAIAVTQTRDALVAETLATRAAYVETFRKSDLLPDQGRSLIYSYRVSDGNRVLGVLCLCFRFEDEVAGIFAKLRSAGDWTVFAFLDADGTVIASSDPWQLPLGAPLTLACDEGGRVIRFGGREYLATTRRTQGYQGYNGPGWLGHAMIPVEHAFDEAGAEHAQQGENTQRASLIPAQVLADLKDSPAIFSFDLRKIPVQADQIQRELNRTVWNGNIRLALRADNNTSFSKVLLWEIGNAGRKTQAAFDYSIGDLQETVISSILQDAQLLASLAIDVLDRNLYERANDCRWWALNAAMIAQLGNQARDTASLTAVLQHINSLYTVYSDIVVFDARQRIVAVSNKSHARLVGQVLNESWVGRTLSLRNSRDFVESGYAPSVLYGNQPTLIFGAVMRNDNGSTAGGVGIVFDTKVQLELMLRDALPRTESGEVQAGCIGAFVDAQMQVIAATSDYQPGDKLPVPADILAAHGSMGERIVAIDGTYYAVGATQAAGYREYHGLRASCVIMIPLGRVQNQAAARRHAEMHAVQRRADSRETLLDIATFHSGHQWLGLPREHVLEAVDGARLRPVPGSPPWHAGLLMFRDAPIPVVDVPRLLNGTTCATGTDVIVARLPNSSSCVGLRIDELASIPEIPASQILAMNEVAGQARAAIVDRAVRPSRPDDPVLFIINLQQLMARVQAGG